MSRQETQVCRRCEVEKPLDEFYLRPENVNGHEGVCKHCRRFKERTQNRKRIRAKPKTRISCPECGIMMFEESLQGHLLTTCKGQDYQIEEEKFSAEHIANECAMIQKEWSPSEKIKRMTAKRPIPWTVPQPKTRMGRKDVIE